MRVLVNYSKEDKKNTPGFVAILQQLGIQAMSTTQDLTIGELLAKATACSAEGIILNNEQTLRYCVPGEAPTADKWRGSRLNFKIPVIVVNKFAHIYSIPHGEWLLRKDLDKLRSIKRKATIFEFTKLTKQSYFSDVLDDLRRAILISYDIETRTLDPKKSAPLVARDTYITCASWTGVFADGSMRTYMLPLVDFDKDHWDTQKEYENAIMFAKRANALMIHKAMHNGMYDATHSLAYNIPPAMWTYDTMAMAHAQFAELPKTLDFVASYELFDYVYWKDDAESASKSRDIEKYWAYNAKDTWYTARIAIQQLRHAPEYAKKNYANKFHLVYPALYCNFEGLAIDEPKRIFLRDAAEVRLNHARDRLRICLADPNYNPGSWQQTQKYIYNVLGAKNPKLGKSKSGTDAKNLNEVATQHPILARVAENIVSYKEDQKAIGTYFDILQYHNRLLWALNPFGTETERMACSASSFWCGTQVQNIPGYAKEAFVADPGFELFEADNKQSEGRTTAYCSQEEALIFALEDANKDFYKTLGTLFLNIPYEEVTDFFRNKVLKRIVHGTNYMMGAKTFIENIGIQVLYIAAEKLGIKIVPIVRANQPQEMTLKGFAQSLLDVYHKPFPRIKLWYDEIYTEVALTGYLVSPLGHTRKFFGDIRKQHAMLRGAVAHQPQNLSVEILNKGFTRVYKQLVIPHNGDIRVKAQIHDSIFGQWRIGMRDYFAPRILECMDNPVTVHGRLLSIPVDIKYGQNWAEASESNSTGTRKWKAPK